MPRIPGAVALFASTSARQCLETMECVFDIKSNGKISYANAQVPCSINVVLIGIF